MIKVIHDCLRCPVRKPGWNKEPDTCGLRSGRILTAMRNGNLVMPWCPLRHENYLLTLAEREKTE